MGESGPPLSVWTAVAGVWLMLSIITVVSGLVMAGVATAMGARPQRVRFHMGPALFSFQALGIQWSVSPLLLGASMTFTPVESVDPDLIAAEVEENTYSRLSLPRRLVTSASTVLGMVLLAGVCLAPSRGLAEIMRGFEQTVNVFHAPERVGAFFTVLERQGFWVALGVLSAKCACINLLPIPPMTGSALLHDLWQTLVTGQRRNPPLPIWSAAVMLVLYAGWGWGLYVGLSALSR